ncbi:MAG: squalene synthase HpnC [Acidobacteria bacterium]|nr:squalene synthase HpnC [Acidobacteriota bacterium]
MARSHYENFPVASWMLPRSMRPHIAAIYAFARTADDFADEGDVAPQVRLRRLDSWGERLQRSVDSSIGDGAVDGGATPEEAPGDGVDHRAVFLALSNTIRVCRLPVGLFEDLLSAFRQDVGTHRYESWDQLLDYCRRSANPVGRLVLRVAGYDEAALDHASDCFCTALQLTNFWQDLERDHAAGRIYVPAEDRTVCGALESDLAGRRLTPGWQAVLEGVGERTRALFDQGRGVCDGVSGRLAMELRLTWLGGLRILERLEQSRFDVFAQRPALGARDGMVILWRTLTWRRR